MIFWKTIDIADNERALLYRRNRLVDVLMPGRHRVLGLFGRIDVAIYDVTDVVFVEPRAKFLLNVHGEMLDRYIERFEMSDTEVGLFYRDGHLVDVLAPGASLAVWRGVENVRVDIVDISEDFAVEPALLGVLGYGRTLDRARRAGRGIEYVEVKDGHVGMLSVNGKYERQLAPGNYGYWTYNRSVVVNLLDMRLQTMEVSGQEILTKDRVSLRINLSASFRIVDPETVVLRLSDHASYIYRELQLRLREAVGMHALDALLEDKDRLNVAIADGIRGQLAEYGIDMVSVGVKDIILPGDMKLILNQVVEAQKESEANLIKRREETQAMRSLHNTAKMMENNPTLLRLKELEALERVTARIDSISVYGGLEGVLNDLVNLGSREVNR